MKIMKPLFIWTALLLSAPCSAMTTKKPTRPKTARQAVTLGKGFNVKAVQPVADIQAAVQKMNTQAQATLDKLKRTLDSGQLSITAKDITSLLATIQQTISQIESYAKQIEQDKAKNAQAIAQLKKLIEDELKLGRANTMTELQESFTLLMGPLENQKDPLASMLTYVQNNFKNTGIDISKNIYLQAGLPEKPTHQQLMTQYQKEVNDPAIPETKKKQWRQITYFTRQPAGMLMYNLWFFNKPGFTAVFSKLPKNELTQFFQYLSGGIYIMKLADISSSL